MSNLSTLGVALAASGASGLMLGYFTYFDTKPVLDAGPIHIVAEEEHRVSISTLAGIMVLAAGIGLIVIGRRAA